MENVSRRHAVGQEFLVRLDLAVGHLALSAADASQFPCDLAPRACPLNGRRAPHFRQTRKAKHATHWRAVFFIRLGEVRYRSFEQQRYRASGLNRLTAAIVLWNTTYLDRATRALASQTTQAEGWERSISPLTRFGAAARFLGRVNLDRCG